MLLYERDALENAAASGGLNMEEIEAQMYLTTKNYVCTSPELEAFINLGYSDRTVSDHRCVY